MICYGRADLAEVDDKVLEASILSSGEKSEASKPDFSISQTFLEVCAP